MPRLTTTIQLAIFLAALASIAAGCKDEGEVLGCDLACGLANEFTLCGDGSRPSSIGCEDPGAPDPVCICECDGIGVDCTTLTGGGGTGGDGGNGGNGGTGGDGG